MTITLLENIPNPDSASIARKEDISIPLSFFDVSASGHFGEVKTNYNRTFQVLKQMSFVSASSMTASMYYTPIYKEKLNYNTWIQTVNKNFDELE